MNDDYDVLEETAQTFKYMRSQARRAFTQGKYSKAIAWADAWDRYMEQHPDAPYPDAWRDIERVREDAALEIRMSR